jgi:hypothetical protein
LVQANKTDSTLVDGATCFIVALVVFRMHFSVQNSQVVAVCGGFNTDYRRLCRKYRQRAHIPVTLVDNVQVPVALL